MAMICKCSHCGEEYGAAGGVNCARFCKHCKTAPLRKAMDEENKEIDNNFTCRSCGKRSKSTN